MYDSIRRQVSYFWSFKFRAELFTLYFFLLLPVSLEMAGFVNEGCN